MSLAASLSLWRWGGEGGRSPLAGFQKRKRWRSTTYVKCTMEKSQKCPPTMKFRLGGIQVKNDVVLDPFAGTGTTGRAAAMQSRRFVLIENEPKYIDVIRSDIANWLGSATKNVLFVGCQPPDTSSVLL
jgi:hypothetical protein